VAVPGEQRLFLVREPENQVGLDVGINLHLVAEESVSSELADWISHDTTPSSWVTLRTSDTPRLDVASTSKCEKRGRVLRRIPRFFLCERSPRARSHGRPRSRAGAAGAGPVLVGGSVKWGYGGRPCSSPGSTRT